MSETPSGPPPCQTDACTQRAHFRTGYTYCLDHDEPVGTHDAGIDTTTAGIATDDFTYYFGASCGSSRKTLRELEEPNVLLSYATAHNTPWADIDSLLVDSGGYSLLVQGEGEYTTHVSDYLAYVESNDADYAMTRDVPITDRVVSEFSSRAEARARSLELTCETLDAMRGFGLDTQPVSVLQGASPQGYVDYYHTLVERDAVTRRLAIGSLKDYDPGYTARIIDRVREAVDDHIELHGLGVEVPALSYQCVRDALASADSSRYIATARWRGNRDEHPPRLRDDEPQTSWLETARAYLDMRADLRDVLTDDSDESVRTQQELTANL